MRTINTLVFVLLIGAALVRPSPAQDSPRAQPLSRGIVLSPDEEYRVGPSDIVEVFVLHLPELSREYRVNADGTIEIPFLGRIVAERKTSPELASAIADGLRGGYVVDPQVSVIVREINRQFFIQGAVRSPGVYNIEGRPSLLELITISGGLNPTYGATAFILHKIRPNDPGRTGSQSDSEIQPEYELRKASISALLRGEFTENAKVEPGDIVHIPPSDIFFVAGEVKAPGSFPLNEGTTVRQAIALAHGTNANAASGRAVIFRETAGSPKQEIPVDVAAVMRGQSRDIPIMPNDIILIPNSKTKAALMPVLNAFGTNAAWAAVTIFR
jgi:polysaccharide export outer membrane protein